MKRLRPAAIRREQSVAGIDLAGRHIEYLLKRSSARRGVALRVNAQGMAQVNAPFAMPLARIEAFLVQHGDWLCRQLAGCQGARPLWQDGMALPFLGDELRLECRPVRAGEAVRVEAGHLVCTVLEARLEAAVIDWYRRQARHLLAERLDAVCRRLGRTPPPWRLSNARTRWGSLSPQGVVGLNWRLVMAGAEEIDYVICHELAHFRHRDHSAAYWREVERLYPGFAAARAVLRENGRRYFAF